MIDGKARNRLEWSMAKGDLCREVLSLGFPREFGEQPPEQMTREERLAKVRFMEEKGSSRLLTAPHIMCFVVVFLAYSVSQIRVLRKIYVFIHSIVDPMLTVFSPEEITRIS